MSALVVFLPPAVKWFGSPPRASYPPWQAGWDTFSYGCGTGAGGQSQLPSTFQAPAWITFVNILLGKASHKAPPKVQGREVNCKD